MADRTFDDGGFIKMEVLKKANCLDVRENMTRDNTKEYLTNLSQLIKHVDIDAIVTTLQIKRKVYCELFFVSVILAAAWVCVSSRMCSSLSLF